MSKLKRLVILDLNGLIIQRLYKNDYAKHKSLLKIHYENGNLEKPNIIGNFAVWFRPNVRNFISWLMDHFHVAIWSSVSRHNIEPIVESLLRNESERSRLLFWWDQIHCHLEEDPTEKNPKYAKKFFKQLVNVWDNIEINERWLLKQPANSNLSDHTLLIDDNPLKARDNPKNTAIHPQAWKLFEISSDDQTIKIYKDNGLDSNGHLRKWLKDLLGWDGTVAEFVEKHPYIDLPLEEIEYKTNDDIDDWGWN